MYFLVISLTDLSIDLRRCISEEYNNESRLCDGEIYRKIRTYHFDKRSDLETRWWTRLSQHRTNNLKQLLQHEKLAAAFDSFLELPALLNDLRISTMHKVFALRCDQVGLSSFCEVDLHVLRRFCITSATSKNSGLSCALTTKIQWDGLTTVP